MSRQRERRRFERFPIHLPSQCAAVTSWTGIGVADLSTSGARLYCELRPALGTLMLLALPPDMMASGSVVRHTEDGFAVAFAPLHPPETGSA